MCLFLLSPPRGCFTSPDDSPRQISPAVLFQTRPEGDRCALDRGLDRSDVSRSKAASRDTWRCMYQSVVFRRTHDGNVRLKLSVVSVFTGRPVRRRLCPCFSVFSLRGRAARSTVVAGPSG